MQIKKITQLGANSGGNSNVGPAPRNAPRSQPKGLKARYQPIGVNSSMGKIGVGASPGDHEDDEMTEAPALPAPIATPAKKSSKKDKNAQKEAVSTPAPKKSKKDAKKDKDSETVPQPTAAATPNGNGKRKHTVSDDDDAAAADQLLGEITATSQSKKQKTGRKGSPDLGSAAPSVTGKRQTPILPPTVPAKSFPSLGPADDASTPPKAASPPATVTRKSKKAKADTSTPAKAKKQTPVPAPRQTAVPVPPVPHSSQSKVSPVPIPQPLPTATTSAVSKDEKKTKKRKDKADKADKKTAAAVPSSQHTPNATKVTPVPAPAYGSS